MAAPSLRALAADDVLNRLDAADQETSSDQSARGENQSFSTIKPRRHKVEDEFIPLLAPRMQPKREASHAENVFHGWLRFRDLYQRNNNGTDDNSSRIDSNGSLERLNGGPAALVWNGNMSYRRGNAYTTADDFEHPRLHMYQAALIEKQEDGGVGRLGRFIPTELPGLGYLDGAQLERHPVEHIRLGAALGARPERRELGLSSRELMTAIYGSYERGRAGEPFYSGTLGLFQTLFGGVRDELAVLYDHRADLGGKLSTFFSSQMNVNTGAAQVHTEGVRLTRLDAHILSTINEVLSVRSGANHFERPDTAAERDLSGGDLTSFDDGTWRYWVGASERLPWKLRLDEEFSIIRSPYQADQGQMRGTLTRQGLWIWNQALLSLTVYSLNRVDGHGAGGLLSAVCPVLDGRLNVTATSGFRYSGQEGEAKSLQTNDASFFLNWFFNRHWQADFGVTKTYQDYLQSTLFDASLSYRW